MTYTLWIEFHPLNLLAAEVLYFQWRKLCGESACTKVVFGATHPIYSKFRTFIQHLNSSVTIDINESSSYQHAIESVTGPLIFISTDYIWNTNPIETVQQHPVNTNIIQFSNTPYRAFYHAGSDQSEEVTAPICTQMPFPCWNVMGPQNPIVDQWFDLYIEYCREYVWHHFAGKQMTAYFAPDHVNKWNPDPTVQHIFTNHLTHNTNIHQLNWIHYFTMYPERGQHMTTLYKKLPGHVRVIFCPFNHHTYKAIKTPMDAFYLIKNINPRIVAPIIFDYRTDVYTPFEPSLQQYMNQLTVGFTSGIRLFLLLTHLQLTAVLLYQLNLYYPHMTAYKTNRYHNYKLDITGFQYCVQQCKSRNIGVSLVTNNPTLRAILDNSAPTVAPAPTVVPHKVHRAAATTPATRPQQKSRPRPRPRPPQPQHKSLAPSPQWSGPISDHSRRIAEHILRQKLTKR